MKRYMTYLNERSPLPALVFLAAGIGMSSMAIRQTINWPLFLFGLLFNVLLFIQMRLGDELKDFETDKIINPTRPLPRGLFLPTEVLKLLKIFLFILLVNAVGITFTKSLLGGASFFMASLFTWLMFKEFYISHELDKSPLLYAFTHQVIVFPLFAWIGLSFDSTLIHDHIFQGWLIANFGASFTFEICRKLDPNAHKLAKTYAHHYGRPKIVLFVSILVAITTFGACWAGFPWYAIPELVLLLLSLLYWRTRPEKYKLPAGLSALSSAIILWAPSIVWMIQSWRAQ